MNLPSPPGDPELPPRLGAIPAPAPTASSPAPTSGLRVVLALGLLTSYVLLPAVVGAARQAGDEAILPATTGAALLLCTYELALFAVAFSLAAWLGRLQFADLWLTRRPSGWTVPRAIGWSLALRFGLGLVLGATLVAWQWIRGQPIQDLQGVRPEVEALVDVQALRDPLYLTVMLTLVSFVLAGLREELWRAAMLSLLGRALPRWFGGKVGPWLAVLPVALLFGLAHTPQGPVGVAATTLLGIGLGAILLFHRSLWDAVLAHGFFNAATFAVLPLISDRFPDVLH